MPTAHGYVHFPGKKGQGAQRRLCPGKAGNQSRDDGRSNSCVYRVPTEGARLAPRHSLNTQLRFPCAAWPRTQGPHQTLRPWRGSWSRGGGGHQGPRAPSPSPHMTLWRGCLPTPHLLVGSPECFPAPPWSRRRRNLEGKPLPESARQRDRLVGAAGYTKPVVPQPDTLTCRRAPRNPT